MSGGVPDSCVLRAVFCVCQRVQINAADAILIFDEAHNIEDQARWVLLVVLTERHPLGSR